VPAFQNYVKLMRPSHWVKQFFIVPGIVLALFIPNVLKTLPMARFFVTLVLGSLATCLIASANYVINEYFDRNFDKYHPTKKSRPAVTTNLNGVIVLFQYTALSILGFVFACVISILYKNFLVLAMLGSLWLMGIAYNVKPLRTKDIIFLDVITESANNVIRLLVGWFIVTQSWFPALSVILGVWGGGGFIMSAKRFAEYKIFGDKTAAGKYRKSFKYYTENSLMSSMLVCAMISIAFLSIFFVNYKPELIISVPFLCILFGCYFLISLKPNSVVQKPEKILFNRSLMIFAFLFLAVFVITLVFGKEPTHLQSSQNKFFDIVFNNRRI
jgi:4-hydroxybenzoate polyprenyltransferase